MACRRTTFNVAALLAILTLLGAANAGAAPIGSFGAPVTLTAQDGNARSPQVAINTRGDAVALWYASDGYGSIVRGSWRPAGAGWSPAVDISSTADARFAHDVDVALADDGTATAMWTAATGPDVDVAVVQTATGSASGGWSTPADVVRRPGWVANGRLAATARGDAAVAVWSYSAFGSNVIEAATRAGGAGWSAPVQLSAAGNHAFRPEIGIDDDGGATALWTVSTSGGRAVQTATHPAGGSWTAAQTLPGSDGDLITASLAVSGTGHAIAAWSRGTSSRGVAAAAVRLAGGDWSAPTDLAGGGAFFPQVAISDKARAVAVWEQSWPDGRASAVSAAARSADGSWSAPVELDARGNQIDVAMTSKGKAVAVWSAWNVLRSATTKSGAAWSPATTVATGPQDKALEGPEVAMSERGDVAAVWWLFTPDPFGPPLNVVQAATGD